MKLYTLECFKNYKHRHKKRGKVNFEMKIDRIHTCVNCERERKKEEKIQYVSKMIKNFSLKT